MEEYLRQCLGLLCLSPVSLSLSLCSHQDRWPRHQPRFVDNTPICDSASPQPLLFQSRSPLYQRSCSRSWSTLRLSSQPHCSPRSTTLLTAPPPPLALPPSISPPAAATGLGRTHTPSGATSSAPPYASFKMKPVASSTLTYC
jgi:hypothetical protein